MMRAKSFAALATAGALVILSACTSDPASATADSDAGSVDASVADEPGPSYAECQSLNASAVTTFASLTAQDPATCAADSDCIQTFLLCIDSCPELTSKANAGALGSAASTACAPYFAAGCPLVMDACPVAPPAICNAGTCAVWEVGVAPIATTPLVRGTCAVFEVKYDGQGTTPLSSDRAVTVAASGATLYADLACTIPLVSDAGALTVTIPAGRDATLVGVVPNATSFQIHTGTDPFLGYYSGTAQ